MPRLETLANTRGGRGDCLLWALAVLDRDGALRDAAAWRGYIRNLLTDPLAVATTTIETHAWVTDPTHGWRQDQGDDPITIVAATMRELMRQGGGGGEVGDYTLDARVLALVARARDVTIDVFAQDDYGVNHRVNRFAAAPTLNQPTWRIRYHAGHYEPMREVPSLDAQVAVAGPSRPAPYVRPPIERKPHPPVADKMRVKTIAGRADRLAASRAQLAVDIARLKQRGDKSSASAAADRSALAADASAASAPLSASAVLAQFIAAWARRTSRHPMPADHPALTEIARVPAVEQAIVAAVLNPYAFDPAARAEALEEVATPVELDRLLDAAIEDAVADDAHLAAAAEADADEAASDDGEDVIDSAASSSAGEDDDEPRVGHIYLRVLTFETRADAIAALDRYDAAHPADRDWTTRTRAWMAGLDEHRQVRLFYPGITIAATPVQRFARDQLARYRRVVRFERTSSGVGVWTIYRWRLDIEVNDGLQPFRTTPSFSGVEEVLSLVFETNSLGAALGGFGCRVAQPDDEAEAQAKIDEVLERHGLAGDVAPSEQDRELTEQLRSLVGDFIRDMARMYDAEGVWVVPDEVLERVIVNLCAFVVAGGHVDLLVLLKDITREEASGRSSFWSVTAGHGPD